MTSERSDADLSEPDVTTLFAAPKMLTGQMISMIDPLHRHQEWLHFLKAINRNISKPQGA